MPIFLYVSLVEKNTIIRKKKMANTWVLRQIFTSVISLDTTALDNKDVGPSIYNNNR